MAGLSRRSYVVEVMNQIVAISMARIIFLAFNFALIVFLCRISYMHGFRDADFDRVRANIKMSQCIEALAGAK
jgi:hypothetical protein